MSDVHLDQGFAWASKQVAKRRRLALRDAFAEGLGVADEIDADAVLLGGDLYERDRFSPDTRAFVRGQLSELGRPVYIAPGNHDCYDDRSIYAQVDWPEHVTVFTDDQLTPVELEDGLTLWGAAHLKPGGTGNFLDGFSVPGDGVHLGLFHGSFDGGFSFEPDSKKPHAPFSQDDLEHSGLHHAFLGHFHHPRHEALFTYPGNPEPLTFGEEGDRGAVEFEVHDDGSVTRAVHDVSQTQVLDRSYDISDDSSLHDIRDGVRKLISEATGCVRIDLTGSLHPDVDLDTDAIVEVGKHLEALVVRPDALQAGYDLNTVREERNIRGQFVRDVENAEDLPEEQRQRVIITGLRAMDGRDDLEVH